MAAAAPATDPSSEKDSLFADTPLAFLFQAKSSEPKQDRPPERKPLQRSGFPPHPAPSLVLLRLIPSFSPRPSVFRPSPTRNQIGCLLGNSDR